jgi:hypothetical protein
MTSLAGRMNITEMEDYKLYTIKFDVKGKEGKFLHRAKSKKVAVSMAHARLVGLDYTITEVREQ